MQKILLPLLLLASIMLYAEAKFNDPRLLRYPEAIEWAKDADTNGESAYNIGVLYQQILHDNAKAIEWYKKAYRMDDVGAAGSAALNIAYIYINTKNYKQAEAWYKKGVEKKCSDCSLGLGLLYKKLHHYDDAIFYYKKAYKMGNVGAATSLGYLYGKVVNDTNKSLFWLKKAVKGGDLDGIKNLGLLNKSKGNKIKGAAYFIALINLKYPKNKVIKYLKTKWHLTDKEIKQAYRLQKTLDIPKHYYDPEFE